MLKKQKLFLFATFMILLFGYTNEVRAESVTVTIKCQKDEDEAKKSGFVQDSTFNFGIKIMAPDTISETEVQNTYSNSTSGVSYEFEKNQTITITIDGIPCDTGTGFENPILNPTNLSFGSGLKGTMINSMSMKITGTITGNADIVIYGVSESFAEVVSYNYDAEDVVKHEAATPDDSSNASKVTKGTLSKGRDFTVTAVTNTPTTPPLVKVMRRLQDFKDSINIITNGLLMLAIMTTLLVIIVHTIKIQSMPSHPMQRRKALEDIIAVVICAICIGSIKLLTVLIIGISAG